MQFGRNFRFTISLRNVENLLAKRGVDGTYEAIFCWCINFGDQFAHNRTRSHPSHIIWHLDVVVKIRREHMWLWQAVDADGECHLFSRLTLRSLQAQAMSRRKAAPAAASNEADTSAKIDTSTSALSR